MSRSHVSPPTPDPLERRLASLTVPDPAPALSDRLHAIPQRDALPPRRPSRRPLVLAAGLAAALAVTAIVTTLPTRHQVAFADVVRSMQGVKTASWRTTLVWNDPKSGRLMMRTSDQCWVRLNPATQVRYSAMQTEAGQKEKPSGADFQDGRVNIYRTAGGDFNDLYYLWPYHFGDIRKNILDGLTFSRQTFGDSHDYKMMPWHSQHVIFGGREVLQFQRDYSDDMHRKVGTDTVLVDPVTNHFLRTEIRQVNPDTGRLYYLTTSDQYRYDADIPAATFDIAPPPGKAVEIQDERPDPALTPDEQRQIKATVDRSNAAYRAGDFAGFAALWDFDYHRTLPEMVQRYPGDSYRQFWQAHIAAQKQSGAQAPGRLLEPLTLLPAPYVYTRRRAADPFPPSPPPGLVRVKATWKFVRRNGTVTQHPVIYDLRRESGGYKLYRWDEETRGRPD